MDKKFYKEIAKKYGVSEEEIKTHNAQRIAQNVGKKH